MPRFVALLRAINAGPGRVVKMGVLRQVFESLGFSEVTTFIASGNVIFSTGATDIGMLEKEIEKRLQEVLRHPVSVFIRSAIQLRRIAATELFRGSFMPKGSGINIIFLPHALGERSKQKVFALRTDTNEFRVHGREIYWLRRRKPGSATFVTVPLNRALGNCFTIRSANTIRKLVARHLS